MKMKMNKTELKCNILVSTLALLIFIGILSQSNFTGTFKFSSGILTSSIIVFFMMGFIMYCILELALVSFLYITEGRKLSRTKFAALDSGEFAAETLCPLLAIVSNVIFVILNSTGIVRVWIPI